MKNTLLFAVHFVLLFFTIESPLHAQKDVSDEIMKANQNFMDLFNAGEADDFVTVYTEDAHISPPNAPAISGRENLKIFWGEMMSAGIKPVLKTDSAKKYGKIAIEEGTVKIYAGDQVVDHVKYIVIWKKVKGTWKMHRDIWNSDNPIPGN